MNALFFRTESNGEKIMFDNVQYLRAIASIVVAVSHIGYVTGFGVIGVAIFFVISGFIMITTSWNKFLEIGAARNFLLRRWARIMLPWWVCLTVKIAMDSRHHPALWIFSSYTLLPISNPSGIIDPIHGVGWSLVWEMLFYYAFALSLFFTRSIAVVAISGFFIIVSIIGYVNPDFQEHNWHGSYIFLLFLSGILIGAARKCYECAPATIYIALTLAAALTVFAYTPIGFQNFNIYIDIAAILAVGGMVFFKNIQPGNFALRALHLVGDASFALYITHTIVIRLIMAVFRAIHASSYLYVGMAVQFAASIVLAILFYKYVESPINRYTHSKLARR